MSEEQKAVFMGDFREFYSRIVSEAPCDSLIVEVGVFLGGSLIPLAKAGAAKGLRVVGVDWGCGIPQAPGYTANALLENMRIAGVKIPIILADSAAAAQLFPDSSCFCVFIDADHEYSAISRDITAWAPKVQVGGILCGHDYNWPGVAQAVDETFGPCGTIDSCWMVRRGPGGWPHPSQR